MIKFPKMHIAASVVNRIMNVHAGMTAKPSAIAMQPRDPTMATPQGAQLDAQLSAPAPPVTADEPVAEAVALKGLL